MMHDGKHNVIGVMVDAIDYETAVQKVIQAAHAQTSLTLTALAVHGVMTGVTDKTHRYRLNHLDLVVPDGQPVRWTLNALHHTGLSDRVYGPTLMKKVCERAAAEDLPIFLYGSSPDVVELLKTNLCKEFPRLQVIAKPSQFRTLSAEENTALEAEIKASGARILFIGMGCPRQEVWLYEHRNTLAMPMLAVGAAFDFHAGLKTQAPPMMQKYGLEWLYRLVQEPARLWKRYLLLNPAYITLVLLHWLGLKVKPLALRFFDADNATEPTKSIFYG